LFRSIRPFRGQRPLLWGSMRPSSSFMGVCASVLSGPGFSPNLLRWTPWSFEMTPRHHGGVLRNPAGRRTLRWKKNPEYRPEPAGTGRRTGRRKRSETSPLFPDVRTFLRKDVLSVGLRCLIAAFAPPWTFFLETQTRPAYRPELVGTGRCAGRW
jgi:hypothetical protein